MLTADGKTWWPKDGLSNMSMPFETYTVSDTTEPVRAGWGMIIVPNYSFAHAPKPQVIVVPAQKAVRKRKSSGCSPVRRRTT